MRLLTAKTARPWVILLAICFWPYATSAAQAEKMAPQATTPAAIPYKSVPAITSSDVGRVVAAFVFVIGVAIAGVYAAKRYIFDGRPSEQKQRRLRVVETRRLTPKFTLFLVELDRKTLLIGQSGDNVTLLDTVPRAEPTTPEVS